MRKELLLSLIAAGAVPTAALANIDVTSTTGIYDATAWQNNGLGGVTASGNFLEGDGSIVVSGASAGSLKFPVTGLPKATYKITANGSNLKLTVGSKTLNVDGTEGNVEFEAEGDFEVVIGYDKIGEYSLTAMKLELVADFASSKTALEAIVGSDETTTIGTPLHVINAETADYGEKHNYKTNAGTPDELQAKIDALQAKLNQLTEANEKGDVQNAIDIYKALNGLTDSDTYEKQVKDIIAEIITYNENMDKQNGASAIWATNQAYKTEQSGIADGYNTTVSQITVGEGDVWTATSTAVAAFNSAYEAYQDELGNLDNDQKDMTTSVATAKDALKNLMDAAVEANTEALADVEAFKLIEGYIAKINSTYSTLYNNFMGLHGTYGSEKAAELATKKNEAIKHFGERKEIEANDNKVADKTYFDEAISEMEGLWTDADAYVKAAEAFYMTETGRKTADSSNTEVDTENLKGLALSSSNLAAAKTTIKGLQDANNKKAALVKEVDDLGSLIDAAQKKADDALVNYKNGSGAEQVSIADDIAAINARIATLNAADASTAGSIAEAQAVEAAYNAANDRLVAAENTLDAEWDGLETASATINAIEGIDGVDLREKYKVAYDGVKNSIKSAKADNEANLTEGADAVTDETLKYIEKGVSEFTEKAAPTANAFTTAANKYNELTEANKRNVNLKEGAAQYMIEGNAADLPLVTNHTEAIETIKTGIVEAAKLEGQALYDAITAVNLEPLDKNGNKVTVENLATEYKNLVNAIIGNNKDLFKEKADAYNTLFTATGAGDTYGPGLGMENGLTATLASYNEQFAQLPVVLTDPSIKSSDFSDSNDWTKTGSGTVTVAMGTVDYFRTKVGESYPLNGVAAPAPDTYHPADMFCAGVSACWSDRVATWSQNIGKLPVGRYILTFDVANPGDSKTKGVPGEGGSETEYKMESLTFVQVGSTKFVDNNISAKDLAGKKGWTGHKITFDVTDAEADVTISFGYKNLTNHGSDVTPELFFSKLKLDAEDYGVSNAVAVSKASYDLYNSMVGDLGSEEAGLIYACLNNVKAHKAIFQGDSDAKDDALSITSLATDETLSAYNKLKGDIFGADAWTRSWTHTDENGTITKSETIAAKPTIEVWCKDNDGDDDNRPTGTYKNDDKSQYKDLFTTDALKAINEAIMADYNANKLTSSCQSSEITALQQKVEELKSAVETNAANHTAALAQADLQQLIIDIREGKVWYTDILDEEGNPTGEKVKHETLNLEAWVNANAKDAALDEMLASYRYKAFATNLAAIEKAIDDAFVATTVGKTEQATQISSLKTALEKLWSDILANENNYEPAKKQYEELTKNLVNDDALAAWIVANSNDPATAAWKETDKYKALVPAYTKIVSDIDEKYANPNAAVQADEQEDAIDKLCNDWTDFQAAVEANEKAHNEQMEAAEKAIAYVMAQIAAVQKSDYNEYVLFSFTDEAAGVSVENAKIDDIIAALKALQQDLTPINNDVYNDFKAMKSASDESTVITRYNKLLAEVDAYVDGITSDYARAVKAKNNETMEAVIEACGMSDLEGKYTSAVKLYNLITKVDVDDEQAYKDYVNALVGSSDLDDYDHEQLQKHYATIKSIRDEFEAKRDAAAPNLSKEGSYNEAEGGYDGILDESAFKDPVNKVAAALTDMNDYISGLKSATNTYAASYYNDMLTAANNLVTEQSGYIKTATSMSDEDVAKLTTISTANATIASAKDYYGKLAKNDDSETYNETSISHLFSALKQLVSVSVDSKGAIRTWWNGIVAKNNTELGTIKNQLDTYAKDVTVSYSAYNSAVDYNTESRIDSYVTGEGEITSTVANRIKSRKSTLDSRMEAARTSVTTAENAWKANKANVDAYNAYTAENGVFETLDADLAIMHEKIGALGLSLVDFQKIPTVAADNAVTAAKSTLEENKTVANDEAATINAAVTAANTAIATAYAKAFDLEKTWLTGLLSSVKKDFNDQYSVSAEGIDFEAVNKVISENETALNGVTTKDAAGLATLKDIETALLNAEADLKTGNNSANASADEAALAQLNGQYNTVKSYIDALDSEASALETLLTENETLLRGWWHEAAPTAEGLQDELDAIQTAYEANGSVETQLSYYQGLLTALGNKVGSNQNSGLRKDVKDVKAAAQTEIDRRNESNALATAVQSNIDEINDYYTQVLGVIGKYEKLEADYEAQENNIQSLLDAAQTELDYAKSGYILENSTSWVYEYNKETGLTEKTEEVTTTLADFETIKTSINTLASAATTEETTAWVNEANTKIAEAEKAVKGNHINQNDLNEALNAIYEAATELKVTGNMEEAPTTIDAAESIIDAVKELVEKAKADVYTLGDIDGSGTVTGNDFSRVIDIIMAEDEDVKIAYLAEAYELNTKQVKAAADVNKDELVGIGDAVMIMRHINGVINLNAAKAAPRRGGIELAANLAQGQLNIDNNTTIASVLVELRGVSQSDITLAARAAGMSLMTNTMSDGTVRVMVIAADGTTLADNSGAVLNIAGNATLSKVVVSDLRGTEYTVVDNNETTAIDKLSNAVKNVGQKVYDMGGKLMNGLKRGVNILRNADGSSTKVIKK